MAIPDVNKTTNKRVTKMSITEQTANNEPLDRDLRVSTRGILSALGSLRLTVFLLVMGLILILVATLQQTRYNIFEVKQQHYSAPLVYIPFQELIIPAWFPNLQDVGGGVMLPSGLTIMLAMLVNLVCAHMIRFRIQATGTRLITGVAVLALGVATTLMVILNGNSGGFQETPLIPWDTQWTLLQVGAAIVGVAGLIGGFRLESPVRRTFSVIAGVGLLAIVGILLSYGESAFIGDSAMRVLWRLIQGTIAAIVCYLGALLVFRRKAGIVVVHSGLLLLMAGELLTSLSAIEQRMFFYEGDTTSHTFNVDESEVALISPVADDKETVVALDFDALKVESTFTDSRLPVRLKPLALFTNSILQKKQPGDPSIPGEQGIAKTYRCVPVAPTSGADTNSTNLSSAYVEVLRTDKDESLGVFLISQQLYQNDTFDLDSFEVDGRRWQIALRFRHYYKPYSVFLESTERTNYLGTTTPRTYSSRFRIIDPQHNTDEIKSVSMNEPLRYNNETFYQSGHDVGPDGRTWSILQIVQNTGWLIPYVSCTFVGFGLFMHFMAIFLRFVERWSFSWSAVPYDRLSWIFVIGSLLIFGMWSYRELKPEKIQFESIDLVEFGKLPVVAGGRVQPLDSVARTILRESRKVEVVVDRNGKEQPAIRWLADWVFDEPGADEYLVFKIDDPEIQSALQLARRKRNMYSIAEINESKAEFDRMVGAAAEVAERDKSELSTFQKRVLELSEHYSAVENVRLAMVDPEVLKRSDPTELLSMARQLATAVGIVKSVPGESEDSWSVLFPVKFRYWLADYARGHNLNTPGALAEHLCEKEAKAKLEEQLFTEELMLDFARIARMEGRSLSPDKLEEIVKEVLNDPDPAMHEGLVRRRKDFQPAIDEQMKLRFPRYIKLVATEIASTLPVNAKGEFDWQSLPERPPLARLDAFWKSRDAAGFNQAVASHFELTSDLPEIQKYNRRVEAEFFQNQAAPFYVASTLYIVASVLVLLSWLAMAGAMSNDWFAGLANGTRRASFWLMVLAFAVHTIGLLLRIYVSGRAPVTSLHSSTIFISWACVLLGMFVERVAGQNFGTLLGSAFGFISLLVSFSLATDGDTFSVMVAVLDTQFWLWTHVVIITLGYSATYASGALGIIFLVASVISPVDIPKVRDILIRLIYGISCLALLLSFVGTVLGGLWADDSWGRFWGWDPKENGALMIVLVNAILLHARWGGMVRTNGVAMIAAFGSIVTTWSWFAVNELGVGLHQYGLTEGRMSVVTKVWLAHLCVISLGWLPARFWLSNLIGKSPPATIGDNNRPDQN